MSMQEAKYTAMATADIPTHDPSNTIPLDLLLECVGDMTRDVTTKFYSQHSQELSMGGKLVLVVAFVPKVAE